LEKRVVGALVRLIFFRGRRGRSWSLPAHLDAARVEFRGNSGARLVGDHVRAAEPRGIVVLVHPDRRYGRHWFAKHGWLDWLVEHHYDALTFDFPVYGESRGGSTYLHEDVLAALHEARRLRPGVPVHVVGLSIGAFATINALVGVDFVASAVLESPYPTFDAWYQERGTSRLGPVNRTMARLFPRTYRRIDAGLNVADVTTPLFIAATRDDSVTPIELTRKVAAAAPPHKFVEYSGVDHLGLFTLPKHREAVLSFLQSSPAARTMPAMVK
jgi:alpha-beta hydrolase superfamily lysophospholipase